MAYIEDGMNRFFTTSSGYAVARHLVLLPAWALHVNAWAQPAAVIPAPAQEPVYRSVFMQYQSFADAVLAPWPEANDTVRAVGGWRAYAKEAAQARAAAQADTAEATPHIPQRTAVPTTP